MVWLAKELTENEKQFAFGPEWRAYNEKYFTREALETAKRSLCEFLQVADLKGRSFLDVGCGTGLFSYAAFELGASEILSTDIDPIAVECVTQLKQFAGSPAHWRCRQGSVLKEEFAGTLPQADIVYAWGVLQHTGAMWKAFRSCAALIRPGGLFYVAVYNHVPGFGPQSSAFWIAEKKIYNDLPQFFQSVIFYFFKWAFSGARFLMGKKTRNAMRRGMQEDVNLRAWLGAWPCEFTPAEKVVQFSTHELGLECLRTNLTSKLGNNEFLFRKPVQ